MSSLGYHTQTKNPLPMQRAVIAPVAAPPKPIARRCACATFLLMTMLALAISLPITYSSRSQPIDTSGGLQVRQYRDMIHMLRFTPGVTPPNAAALYAYASIGVYELTRWNDPGESLRTQFGLKKSNIPVPNDEIKGAVNYFFKRYFLHFFASDVCYRELVNASAYRYAGEEQSICPSSNDTVRQENLNRITTTYMEERRTLAETDRAKEAADSILEQLIQKFEDSGSTAANFGVSDLKYPGSWRPTADLVISGQDCWPDSCSMGGTGFTVINGSHDGLLPYWGFNAPLTSEQCITNTQPVDPPMSNSSLHKNRVESIFIESTSLTEEQRNIAAFWNDFPGSTATPPGHTLSIASQLAEQNNLGMRDEALMYAMVGIAVNDAFISCWKAKYNTNLERPITAIRRWFDDSWSPLLTTPPFPEYTSGHSVQTAAAIQVLIHLFGDRPFADATHVDRTDFDGSIRYYDSLSDLAFEAAMSRIYGGIHYQEAVILGLYQGMAVGRCVIDLFDNQQLTSVDVSE